MDEREKNSSVKYFDYATVFQFLAGALITSVFSGSLATLASHARLTEVLIAGMVIPSFTWIVQLTVSAIGLGENQRRDYWRALGGACLVGSVALLPAALANLIATSVSLWISAANVLISVVLMGAFLFRTAPQHNVSRLWPLSWCLTIAANMTIFVWWSWNWW